MIELTDKDFEKTVAKGNVIVDFWAEWCGPCETLAPTITDLEQEHTDVQFAKLNIDDHPETPGNYGIKGIPTLLFFKDGERVDQITGVHPRSTINDKIKGIYE